MPAEAYDDAGSFDRGSSSPCSLFSRFRAPSRGTGSNRLLRSGLAALAILALTGTGSVALADTLNFQADLVGRQEVPPNDSTATGHVEATLDTSANTLTWTVVYSGLSGAPIGAHFHGPVSYVGATSEENAPIQVGTPGNLASPFHGKATIDAMQAEDLKIGRWYFNLHSPKYPGGEIRGPVVRK